MLPNDEQIDEFIELWHTAYGERLTPRRGQHPSHEANLERLQVLLQSLRRVLRHPRCQRSDHVGSALNDICGVRRADEGLNIL